MKAEWTLLLMPWGRVGSNLCMDTFIQAEGVAVFNEPLTRIKTENLALPSTEIWKIQKKWLEENLAGPAEGARLIVNLSAVSIVDFDAFVEFAKTTKCHLIVLDRRSEIRTAISAIRVRELSRIAKNTGEAERWDIPSDKVVAIKPTVDPAVLRHYIHIIRTGRAKCMKLLDAVGGTIFWYEDWIRSPVEGLEMIASAAGLGPFPFKIIQGKLSPNDIEEAVGNPELVYEIMKQMDAQ
jgi:hypothetical protein